MYRYIRQDRPKTTARSAHYTCFRNSSHTIHMLNRTVIIFIQSPFHCPRHSRSLTSVATQQLLQEVLRRECYHTKGGKECLSAFHTFPWTPYKQLVLFPYFTKLSDVNIIDIEYHCFSSYFVKYTVHGKLINSTEQSPC